MERPFEEEENERLAQEMRSALRRVDAPDGFTERVMARAAVHDAVVPARFASPVPQAAKRGTVVAFRKPVWQMAYAAAALLAVTAGTVGVQRHRAEQRRVDAAAAQFDQAMQVTGHALDHVSARLEQTGLGEVQRVLGENGGR